MGQEATDPGPMADERTDAQPMISRRGLLKGRIGRSRELVRPPWSRPGSQFTSRCTRCSDCIEACPEKIIVVGDGGFPEVDFQIGPCTFCEACREACPTGAIAARSCHEPVSVPPWSIKAHIGGSCLARKGVECRICEDHCDPRAIRFERHTAGVAIPQLDRDQCTGCGACISVCPVSAIEIRTSVT